MKTPDYTAENISLVLLAFAAYFIGIVIRKKVFPGQNSSPLSHQCLLGIPVSLIVVGTFYPIIQAAQTGLATLFITFGIIIEHGMIVQETVTFHLKRILAEIR